MTGNTMRLVPRSMKFVSNCHLLEKVQVNGRVDASITLATKWKVVISIALFAILMEIAAYAYFHTLMSAQLRASAVYTIEGGLADENSYRVPMIKPYVWSNYVPNPESKHVNRLGWRYGGGPKTRPFRILCLGGSTTWSDKATSPERSYPAHLERYLNRQGFELDVVNGGCPYYTSAELVGTLAFRGIYTDADLIVLHTGGNDTDPLRSPKNYKPDYTHWRSIDPEFGTLNRNETFRVLWRIPSWTSRTFLTLGTRPNAFQRCTTANQLTSAQDGLLATNDISERTPVGLEKNLRSLIALGRAHGAKLVTVTFNMRYEKLHTLLPKLERDSQEYFDVVNRSRIAMEKSNATIHRVSKEMNVPVIQFDGFEPSSSDYWADQCHLTDEGCREKAIFIGDRLIAKRLLPQPKSR